MNKVLPFCSQPACISVSHAILKLMIFTAVTGSGRGARVLLWCRFSGSVCTYKGPTFPQPVNCSKIPPSKLHNMCGHASTKWLHLAMNIFAVGLRCVFV